MADMFLLLTMLREITVLMLCECCKVVDLMGQVSSVL